jgi:hypothetical protein
MTAKRPPMRRPRRANSFKDLKRLLGGAEVAHGKSRRDRLLEQAAFLAETEAAARQNYFKIQILNMLAAELGFQLVVNDLNAERGAARVFHFLEERPGAVGRALLDDGPVGDALRHLKGQALDSAAAPLLKRRATVTRARINEAIMAIREADPAFMAEIEAAEKTSRDTAHLMTRYNQHDFEPSWQELATSEESQGLQTEPDRWQSGKVLVAQMNVDLSSSARP